MRILHFGSNYLPNKGGNVVRMTHLLENNQAGAELFIMTTAKKGDFDDDAYFEKTSIRIIRINELKDAYKALPEAVEKYNIDAVVTHIIPANVIACRCLPSKVKIFTEIHSLIDSGWLKNFGKDLLHRFFLNRRTEKYFVLSMGAAKYIKKHYGVRDEKIVFLPNSCKMNDCQYSKGRKGYFTFGYVGTFYEWQGIRNIYDNVERILSIGDDVRLYLVGGGKLENELKKLSERYPDRLILTGLIPKAEVPSHYDEIDVLMIPRPSTLETETAIPLKIFDSIEAGKPVIISDVFGLTEVLGENEAFVYKSSDPDGLYKACETAYKEQELSKQKYENAVKRLSEWPEWKDIHNIQFKTISGEVK